MSKPQSWSKRNQLLMVFFGTLTIAAAIWFGLLQPQREEANARLKLISETQEKLRSAHRSISLTEKFKNELAATQQRLEAMESRMPAGDIYRWMFRTFASLQTKDVEIGNLEPPRIGDGHTLPKVPYKTATFALTGTAYYHDFGRFLASLENRFPHIRLQKLELEPTQYGDPMSEEQEKLNFRIEAVALIKSSASDH